jgi:preprotein translocase subunit SecE
MAKSTGKTAKPNVAVRFVQYLKDVRAEMKRVVWPDREEVVNSSAIVIVTLLVFIVFVLIVDQISSFIIIEQLASLGG